MRSLAEVLSGRGYPGRGCLATRTQDGVLHFAYFLTGRSQASRARALAVLPSGDLQVRDTGHGPHDGLRHYTAVARRGSWFVVGNGDQVVPLAEDLARGVSEVRAGQAHAFEPDPPIFTPRIWMAHSSASDVDCLLGFARRSARGDGRTDRTLIQVESLIPGTGILMTTYDGSASEVHTTPSASDVTVDAVSGQRLLTEVWAGLDYGLRVAAVVLQPGDSRAEPLLISP
jgi:IMP cyclohydrolase